MQKSSFSDSGQFEQAILDRIRQLGLEADPDFLLELIESYAPLFERLHKSLLEAYSKKDRGKIHYASHSLKGASLNIGASDLAAVSLAIEDLSEQADFDTIKPLLPVVARELEKTSQALLAIKARISRKDSSTSP